MNIIFAVLNYFIQVIKLLKPGGVWAVAAEIIMLRQQLIIVERKQKRSPLLKTSDRFLFGLLSFLIRGKRLLKTAIIIKPATIIKFQKYLVDRKYRLLFSKKTTNKPGPKGPSSEIIELVLEIKRRNPRFGYLRIALQIINVFNIVIDKDVVRRILATHCKLPPGGSDGPSWLTFIADQIDSLWSIDLFRVESIILKSFWIAIVMDVFSRRIIGFAIHKDNVDGIAACCMFNQIKFNNPTPKYLSSDNDPIFKYIQWKANLRILEIKEIKSVPYLPISHCFVERLIGIIRQEFLDHILFWNKKDLEKKLGKFVDFYNQKRAHMNLNAKTPQQIYNRSFIKTAKLSNIKWENYCNGLFKLPIAA